MSKGLHYGAFCGMDARCLLGESVEAVPNVRQIVSVVEGRVHAERRALHRKPARVLRLVKEAAAPGHWAHRQAVFCAVYVTLRRAACKADGLRRHHPNGEFSPRLGSAGRTPLEPLVHLGRRARSARLASIFAPHTFHEVKVERMVGSVVVASKRRGRRCDGQPCCGVKFLP
jgi:ribosomal protein L14